MERFPTVQIEDFSSSSFWENYTRKPQLEEGATRAHPLGSHRSYRRRSSKPEVVTAATRAATVEARRSPYVRPREEERRMDDDEAQKMKKQD
nr:hypothetical protein Iba_chr01dCG2430 [Ipomoea batatas]